MYIFTPLLFRSHGVRESSRGVCASTTPDAPGRGWCLEIIRNKQCISLSFSQDSFTRLFFTRLQDYKTPLFHKTTRLSRPLFFTRLQDPSFSQDYKMTPLFHTQDYKNFHKGNDKSAHAHPIRRQFPSTPG